jgi:hypothetical protein
MRCLGGMEGCNASEVGCDCGVMSCGEHGHMARGDDPYCPNLQPTGVWDETGGRGYEDLDLSDWEEGRG